MSGLIVVGSAPETSAVAERLGLACGAPTGDSTIVAVVSSADDLGAVRDAVAAGSTPIAAVIAIHLDEQHLLEAYDLGVGVVIGYCDRADLDAAIVAAPDPAGREIAAALAAVSEALVDA